MNHAELVADLCKPGQEIIRGLTPHSAHLWHMATGICTEAGELLDAVKKVSIYNKMLDLENVVEELGDLEFFMEGLRSASLISRNQTLEHNITKLLKRYPDAKYSNKDAQERKDKNVFPSK